MVSQPTGCMGTIRLDVWIISSQDFTPATIFGWALSEATNLKVMDQASEWALHLSVWSSSVVSKRVMPCRFGDTLNFSNNILASGVFLKISNLTSPCRCAVILRLTGFNIFAAWVAICSGRSESPSKLSLTGRMWEQFGWRQHTLQIRCNPTTSSIRRWFAIGSSSSFFPQNKKRLPLGWENWSIVWMILIKTSISNVRQPNHTIMAGVCQYDRQ